MTVRLAAALGSSVHTVQIAGPLLVVAGAAKPLGQLGMLAEQLLPLFQSAVQTVAPWPVGVAPCAATLLWHEQTISFTWPTQLR